MCSVVLAGFVQGLTIQSKCLENKMASKFTELRNTGLKFRIVSLVEELKGVSKFAMQIGLK